MTPDELLQAKIAEVRRRVKRAAVSGYSWSREDAFITHAFDVQAENWTPQGDPDLLLAREIAVWRLMDVAPAAEVDLIVVGRGDEWEAVTQPLAIIRAHRAKQTGSGG